MSELSALRRVCRAYLAVRISLCARRRPGDGDWASEVRLLHRPEAPRRLHPLKASSFAASVVAGGLKSDGLEESLRLIRWPGRELCARVAAHHLLHREPTDPWRMTPGGPVGCGGQQRGARFWRPASRFPRWLRVGRVGRDYHLCGQLWKGELDGLLGILRRRRTSLGQWRRRGRWRHCALLPPVRNLRLDRVQQSLVLLGDPAARAG